MYAIVEISGKQFKVAKDQKLKVPLQNSNVGNNVSFDRIMALEDDKGQLSFGTPILNNMQVTASIIEHGREKKIIVFKKKRRKGYRKKHGHRQDYSLIEITDIGAAKKTKAPAKTVEKKISDEKVKKAEVKVEKPEVTKPSVKKTSTTKEVKTPIKKTATAKPKATKTKTATAGKEDSVKKKVTPAKPKTQKTVSKKDVKEK